MATMNEWKPYDACMPKEFPKWYDILLRDNGNTIELNLFINNDSGGKWYWYWMSMNDHGRDYEIPEAIAGDVEAMQSYVVAAYRMR